MATFNGTSAPDNPVATADDDTIRGFGGDDTLDGLAGNDNISGGTGNDSLIGRAGNDSLDGGLGNDSLDGGLGDDSLVGGLGDDSLVGGRGTDILVGGFGNDTLTGGAGADTFVFNSPEEAVDTISNFVVEEDIIQISATGFEILLDDFDAFAYDEGTGELTFDGDVLAVLDPTVVGVEAADLFSIV